MGWYNVMAEGGWAGSWVGLGHASMSALQSTLRFSF